MKKLISIIALAFLFSCEQKEEITPKKVLVVGNSITLSVPYENSPWQRTCGMASSSIENDFCGLLEKYLNTKVERLNVAYWENDFNNKVVHSVKDYDLIIFKLGENVSQDNPYFKEEFANLIDYFKSKKTKIILVSTIWHEYDFIDGIPYQRQSKKDNAIKQIAEENNYDFVDISEIRNEELFFAYDEFPNNRDIGAHPNDLGMRFIFNKIIEKL